MGDAMTVIFSILASASGVSGTCSSSLLHPVGSKAANRNSPRDKMFFFIHLKLNNPELLLAGHFHTIIEGDGKLSIVISFV